MTGKTNYVGISLAARLQMRYKQKVMFCACLGLKLASIVAIVSL